MHSRCIDHEKMVLENRANEQQELEESIQDSNQEEEEQVYQNEDEEG